MDYSELFFKSPEQHKPVTHLIFEESPTCAHSRLDRPGERLSRRLVLI